MQFFYLFFKKLKKFSILVISFLFNKKVLKILFCILSILFLIVSPSYIFNINNYKINLNEYLNLQNKQKVVLDLWHIETFEGGSNSRSKFLEKQAIKFNKENNNCYISISTLNDYQLFENLSKNKVPDLFSFGIGVGYMLSNYLNVLNKNNSVRKDLIEYGCLNEELLAYPYILSGYAIISFNNNLNLDNQNKPEKFENQIINKKEVKGLGFASSTYLNISKVLTLNGYENISKNNYYESNSTYDAYVNFISKKFLSLVGTTRDVVRCKNREEKSNLSSCKYTFLSGYSDLIQYVSFSKNISNSKKDYAQKFCSFLTSKSVQEDLSNYGLFSTTKQKLYSSDYMYNFESTLNKPLKSINVFSSLQEIKKQQELSNSQFFA